MGVDGEDVCVLASLDAGEVVLGCWVVWPSGEADPCEYPTWRDGELVTYHPGGCVGALGDAVGWRVVLGR